MILLGRRTVIATVIFAVTLPVLAQGVRDHAMAEACNRRGLELVDALRFEEATTEFRRAYDLYPDPKYLFNAARSMHLSNDVSGAITFYRRYLNEKPDAEDRAEVESWIADCERLLQKTHGELGVHVSPPEARVFLDGVEYRSPLRILLPPGTHDLVVESLGYVRAARSVEVVAGRSQTLQLDLVPQKATTLRVAANLAGARVFMDGALVGTIPIGPLEVQPGTHRLRIEAEGYRPFERVYEVSRGESLNVDAILVAEQIEPSRGAVIWRSALFPGVGQIHAGQDTIGAIFIASEAVCLGGLIVGLSGRAYFLDRRDSEKDPSRWSTLNRYSSTFQWVAIGAGIGAAVVWVANLLHAAVTDLSPSTPHSESP